MTPSSRGGALLLSLALGSLILAAVMVPSAPRPTGAQLLPETGFTTDLAVWPAGATVHPIGGFHDLHLTVTLRPSDPVGLDGLLASLSNPSSPGYRHFLTFDQFAHRYSPTPSTVDAVIAYFAGCGAHDFVTSADRLEVSFAIPIDGAARALGITFSSFGPSASAGYAALGTPTLPATIGPSVAAISGLGGAGARALSAAVAHLPGLQRIPASPDRWVTNGGGAGEPWFLGSDYSVAYHAAQLFPPSTAVVNATFPNRTAVATLLMSGYNASTDGDLPPFDPVVIDSYFNDTFPASWPHPNVSGVPVNASGVAPPAPGYFGGLNDTTANSYENALDLEMAGSMAPGATLVNFYFAGSLFASPRFSETLPMLADAFAQCLAAALAHNYSPARLAAVSGSFGLTDLNDTLWNTELEVAQAMGVTVIAASGDQGNAPNFASGRFQGPGPTWPGTAAFGTYGTIAVGGTSVQLDGVPTEVVPSNGTLNATFDASVTTVLGQTAWYDDLGGFGNISGTEGGASSVFAEPAWQIVSAAQPSIVNATVEQGAHALGRSEPDLAFPANTTIAYVARDAGGTYFEVLEGTSVAAPLFAGLIATWSAVSGHPFGFIDPELYRIASYYEAHPNDPTDPYLDVVQGGNYVFSAAPGWDATTGWGGIEAVRFLAADANASVRDYLYTGPTPGLPPGFAIAPGTTTEYLVLFAGVTVAALVVVAIFLGSRRGGSPPATPYPLGAGSGFGYPQSGTPLPPPAPGPGPWPPPAPGSLPSYAPPAPWTFSCPYCGAPRPAEPTRCPNCGRL